MHALDEKERAELLAEKDSRVARLMEEVDHWKEQYRRIEAYALSGHFGVNVALQKAKVAHGVDVAKHRAQAARDVLGEFKVAHGIHDQLEHDGETVKRAAPLQGKALKAHELMEKHCCALEEHAAEEERRCQVHDEHLAKARSNGPVEHANVGVPSPLDLSEHVNQDA